MLVVQPDCLMCSTTSKWSKNHVQYIKCVAPLTLYGALWMGMIESISCTHTALLLPAPSNSIVKVRIILTDDIPSHKNDGKKLSHIYLTRFVFHLLFTSRKTRKTAAPHFIYPLNIRRDSVFDTHCRGVKVCCTHLSRQGNFRWG